MNFPVNQTQGIQGAIRMIKPFLFDDFLTSALICPECYGQLDINSIIKCSQCKREFSISHGIPILISKHVNKQQLIGEENMAHDLNRFPNMDEKEKWLASKKNFLNELLLKIKIDSMPILNIGCGIDDYGPILLQKSNSKYIQADLSLSNLLRTKALGGKYLICCDISHMPFPDEFFGTILCIDIIHHFDAFDIRGPLKEMVRVLQKDGILLIQETNRLFLPRIAISMLPRSIVNMQRRARKIIYGRQTPAEYERSLFAKSVIKILKESKIHNASILPCPDELGLPKALRKIWQEVNPNSTLKRDFGFHWIVYAIK